MCHDYESKGRGFESRRAHQKRDPRKPYKTRFRGFFFVSGGLWKTPVENGKKLRYYRATTELVGGYLTESMTAASSSREVDWYLVWVKV